MFDYDKFYREFADILETHEVKEFRILEQRQYKTYRRAYWFIHSKRRHISRSLSYHVYDEYRSTDWLYKLIVKEKSIETFTFHLPFSFTFFFLEAHVYFLKNLAQWANIFLKSRNFETCFARFLIQPYRVPLVVRLQEKHKKINLMLLTSKYKPIFFLSPGILISYLKKSLNKKNYVLIYKYIKLLTLITYGLSKRRTTLIYYFVGPFNWALKLFKVINTLEEAYFLKPLDLKTSHIIFNVNYFEKLKRRKKFGRLKRKISKNIFFET